MIAYCGLDCAHCDAYMAAQEDSNARREKTAQKWSKMYKADIKPEQIDCDGCKSNGVKFFHCNVCEIRRCCVSRNVDHCAACQDYVCETLAKFIQMAPEAGRALERLRS